MFAKVVAAAVGGLALAALYVAAVGILTIRASGKRDGAAYNLQNELVEIVNVSTPVLEPLAIAALGAAIFTVAALVARRWAPPVRAVFVASLAAAVVYSIIWAFINDTDVAPRNPETLEVSTGWQGWKGWIEHGADNNSVQLLALLLIGTFVVSLLNARKSRSPAEQ